MSAKSVFIVYGIGTVRCGIVQVTISLGKTFKGSKLPIIFPCLTVSLIILPVKINERRLINHLVKHVRAVRIFVSAKGLNRELFVFPYLEQIRPLFNSFIWRPQIYQWRDAGIEPRTVAALPRQNKEKKTEDRRNERRTMLSEREQRIASREGEQSTKYREKRTEYKV